MKFLCVNSYEKLIEHSPCQLDTENCFTHQDRYNNFEALYPDELYPFRAFIK